MFVERAEIPVKPGMEAEFAAMMVATGRDILASAPGCQSVKLGRGVENPGTFLLLLEWDAVESHTAFTRTAEFKTFAQSAGPFFAGPSNMEHFELF